MPHGTIPFVKASACGNDFLLIRLQAFESIQDKTDIAAFTRDICNRLEGVGADGVEWMYPHAMADVGIRLINADGSEAEISGNGTRCVAAYICSQQQKEKIRIHTGAGLKTCILMGQDSSAYEFEIEMGEATVGAEMAVENGIHGIPVSMGNPHYVVFVPKLPDNWRDQSAEVQRSPKFEHGVNVEMVMVDGKHDVSAYFFERGVGETQSSGTGSCASAVAAISTGKAESPVRVHAPGGTQTVRTVGNLVWLQGTAQLICRGEFFVD